MSRYTIPFEGMFQRTMIAATDTLEAAKAELAALFGGAPADTPDNAPKRSTALCQEGRPPD